MWGTVQQWLEAPLEWPAQLSRSHRAQLVITALFSGTLIAGSIFTYQRMQMESRTRQMKSEIPEAFNDHITLVSSQNSEQQNSHRGEECCDEDTEKAIKDDNRSVGETPKAKAEPGNYDEDLVLEQLARNRVFLSEEGFQKLRSAFIIVVGCGGVGSHCATALARSGVSRIRLIDFDQVTLSSLNRHAVATLADVGTPKVQCLRKHLDKVTPWVIFDCRKELFSKAVASRHLEPWEDGQTPTFVVDAIDNIDSKVELLYYCHERFIPVISSMGAGCKSDPTRILVGDISATTEDPLSRSTRRRLRFLGITDGIPAVYSSEKPAPGKAQLLPLPEGEFTTGTASDLGVLPDFRVRILPVLGTMPAIFGLCIANHIMLSVSNYPHEYLPSKSREKLYESALASLHSSEERLARWVGDTGRGLRLPITQNEVGYLIDEVYRGRSVLSGLSTRLTLVRWSWTREVTPETFIDNSVPGQKVARLKLYDLVCMSKDEGLKHEQSVLMGRKTPEDVYQIPVTQAVKKIREEETHFQLPK